MLRNTRTRIHRDRCRSVGPWGTSWGRDYKDAPKSRSRCRPGREKPPGNQRQTGKMG